MEYTPDPYTRRPEDAREPPRGFGATIKYLGPGLIIAGSVVGSGEIILTTTLGSIVGFTMLWWVLFSCWSKSILQAELGRCVISSGETGIKALNRVPGKLGGVSWVVLLWLLILVPGHLVGGGIYGGVGQKPQVDAMRRGVDIIVATPGRLLDLMNQGHVKLGAIEHFVLDEADRMLDMGFIRDVRKIVSALPRERQTLFFSATMPEAVTGLAGDILHQPIRVAVTPTATTVEKVDQRVFFVAADEKRALLAKILLDPAIERTIVFTRTKHRANRVAEHLNKIGIHADAIHGNKSQGARQRALDGFRKGRVRVLVATDIAARGIDVNDVTHVINFELPNVPEDYVHRIGRTARAGASGVAIALCDPSEQAFLRAIESLTRGRLNVAGGEPAHYVPKAKSGQKPGRSGRNRRPSGGPRKSRRAA